jgi:hypothetical protein
MWSSTFIDEVGYLTYGTDAANMLFHVVNDRHRKKRAMIFTTNKALSAWGRVLHDEDLAHAILDRILELVLHQLLERLADPLAHRLLDAVAAEERNPFLVA